MALSAHKGSGASQSVRPIDRKTRPIPSLVTPVDDVSEDEDELLSIAIEQSLDDSRPMPFKRIATSTIASTSYHSIDVIYAEVAPPTHLETAITFAGTAHSPVHTSSTSPGQSTSVFGKPNLLSSARKDISTNSNLLSELDTVTVDETASVFSRENFTSLFTGTPFEDRETQLQAWTSSQVTSLPDHNVLHPPSDSDEELEEVLLDIASATSHLDSTSPDTFPVDPAESVIRTQDSHPFVERSLGSSSQRNTADDILEPSRTPSPVPDPHLVSSAAHDQEWDAANEMDVQAEEGEFARFISHVKGKNLDDVRKEIDDEINDLNRQRRAAMRDSEDITQQMITQIMVCFLINNYLS